MDTLKIKAVLQAVKQGSLSKAAEEFSYTPSALSHSVASLEKELGVKLLVRTHKGVELSEEGRLLRERLNAVLTAEAQLKKSAACLAGKKQNQLRIGTYSSISSNLLPELLNGFKELYPDIGISIRVGNYLGEWLENDIADVIFGSEINGQEWFPVMRDDFVAVVPASDFAGRKSVRIEQLYPFPFILTENLSVTSELGLERFGEIIRLTSEDDMSAVSMVSQGMGVTVLPSLVLKNCPENVRVLKLEPEIYRTLGISYKKGHDCSLGAGLFVQYLKSLY